MSFKPENVPQLSIYLTVSNADEAIKFYRDAFGFELLNKADDGNGNIHVEMKKGEAYIMFCPEGSFGNQKKTPKKQGVTMPVNFYVYTENTDDLYKTALSYGAKTVMEPMDGFWGDRFCSVLDLDGYEWGFGTVLSKK